MQVKDLLVNDRFRKYVLNPNQGDQEYWEEWQKESEDNKTALEEAKAIISGFYEPLSAEEFQTEAISFKRKINITHSDKNNIINLYESRNQRKSNWPMRVAATLLIVVSATIAMYWLLNDQGLSDQVGYEPTLITKETGKGQKMTITFQDGTVVKLNSESSIVYPEEFDTDLRKVILKGEAYFDVAHYEKWPFIVQSKEVVTKVLGTSFNITSYPETNFIDIALVEGVVEVSAPSHQAFVLEPMKMAKIQNDKSDIEVHEFDFRQVAGWKDNLIVFDKASFSEVKNTLERWYNVKFDCKFTPVFDGGYTGEFADQSLDAVLAGMSTGKFKYKIEGKNIIIN